MALELVGGAVLGAAVAQLLKAVIGAKDKAYKFQPALTRLESTLRSLLPRANEIMRLNQELKISNLELEELFTILRDGEALVDKCSNVSCINFFKKVKYFKLLMELDCSLLRYLQIMLPLDLLKDTKTLLLMVSELHQKLVDEGKASNLKVDDGESSMSKWEKVLLMMRGSPLLGAKDEAESSKSKDDESSQEPDEEESSKPDEGEQNSDKKIILEGVIKIEDQIISSLTLFTHQRRSELETWEFGLKGCTYIFGPEEYSINHDEKIWYQEMGTNYVANCQCKKRHGYVMVSRIEKVRIGKSEFEQQMETFAKIENHPNIVPLFGYCFYQSELFLFYDTFPKGAGKGASLYTRLHGDSWRVANPDSPLTRITPHEFSLESNLKIAHGVARGISHLHSVECIHGNLHSYNVIINSDLDGCISDYGLLNFSSAAKQSDVYSFGVILLEMLSGTYPPDFEDHHRWVEEVVSVQKKIYSRTNTLFGIVDKQGRKMLKIAMLCVEKDLDKRPEMDNVVKMIQKI